MASVQRPAHERQPTFFRAWREKADLKQYQAAERIGIEASSLSRLEKGTSRYDQFILEKMAEVYKCEPYMLIAFDPAEDKEISEIIGLLQNADKKAQVQALGMVRLLIDQPRQDSKA